MYEFFKHYLNGFNKEASPPEDTISDLRESLKAQQESSLVSRGSEDVSSNGGDKDSLWDSIVTDLPRQVRVKQEVLAESLRERNSMKSELIHQRTFPNYRTEV